MQLNSWAIPAPTFLNVTLIMRSCKGLKLQASISNSAATVRQLIGCLCTQKTVAGNGYVNTTQSGIGDCQIRPCLYCCMVLC